MRPSRLMLLDTASLYFRAFFGVPDSFRAPDGAPVNAVRGLLDFMARLINDYRPSHVAACWDNDWRPAWRVELLPSYKTHRVIGGSGATAAGPTSVITQMASLPTTKGEQAPDALAVQVPMIIDVLHAIGIAIVGKDGYEADDVIATLAATAGIPTDVVTGDRDLFQVVDDERDVRVLYTARGVGRHEVVTNAWVQERYHIPARAYVDYATLRGDASDGLPGVAGIGEKTAADLINRYQNLEGILAAASGPSPALGNAIRAKLSKAIDYLAVAPDVVRAVPDLDLDVSLDNLRLPTRLHDLDAYADLFERLGLGGSANRLLEALQIEDPIRPDRDPQ